MFPRSALEEEPDCSRRLPGCLIFSQVREVQLCTGLSNAALKGFALGSSSHSLGGFDTHGHGSSRETNCSELDSQNQNQSGSHLT